jgi:hypothetical protein
MPPLSNLILFLISTLNLLNRLLNPLSTSLKAKYRQVMGIESAVSLDAMTLGSVSVRWV